MSCSPRLSSEKNYKEKKIITCSFNKKYEIEYLNKKSRKEKRFSLKKIELKSIVKESERKECLEGVRNAYRILKQGIPNVLKAYGSYYDIEKQEFRFSTDQMHTDLASFVKKKGHLNMETFTPIFTDILRGKV